jgi:hypothetical protein
MHEDTAQQVKAEVRSYVSVRRIPIVTECEILDLARRFSPPQSHSL